MYEYTDKVILVMRKRFVKMFSEYKAQLNIDEVNVLKSSKTLYDDLFEFTVICFEKIAKRSYKRYGKKQKIDRDWVLDFLEEYDPVTKYVFAHEVERKQARFAESLISSPSPTKEVDTALRYWSKMASQYAIEVTDRATLDGMKDSGVKKVEWVAVEDPKTCVICDKRNGKIYDIDKVPPKAHIGCRCYLKPYKEVK